MADIEAPKVEVEVKFQPQPAAPAIAALPAMIIGPAYLVEKGFLAGPYDPAFGLSFNIESGNNLVFDSNYTKIYILDTVKNQIPYQIFDGAAYLSGNTAQLIGFTKTAAPNDILRIVDPISGGGDYVVSSVVGNLLTCTGLNFPTAMSGSVQLLIHKPIISGLNVTIAPRVNIETSNSIYISTPSVNSSISYISGFSTPPIPGTSYIRIDTIIDSGLLGVSDFPYYAPVTQISGNFYVISHPLSFSSGNETNVIGARLIPYADSLSGNTLIDYRFLRIKKGVFTVSSIDDIVAEIGPIDKDNPLAFGLSMALQNTNSLVYGVAIDSDDDLGYENVQDFVSQYRVYTVVPLTNDPSVLLSYKSLISVLNSVAKTTPRQLIATSKFLEKKTIHQEAFAHVVSESFRQTVLAYTDPYDITIGDTVEISGPIIATAKVISTSAQQFIIDANLNLLIGTQIQFKVLRNATKLDQVDFWSTIIYNDRHVTEMLPDVFISNGIEYPMYFAAAGLAGLDAEQPPQVQFNGFSIAGVDNIKHSNFYFTEDQLNKIAGSGKLILVQDTPDSIPYIRNQITTDVSSVLVRSRNVIKSIDTFILMATDSVKPLLRRYNVVAETLELIHLTLQGVIQRAKNERVTGSGGIILDGRIVSLRRDPNSINAVIVEIDLVFAVPLERIRIILNVSA
ncbi:MAG: hypothetical protein QXP66_00900 [Candidatus Aenigmatarchaeota archaeon]